MSLDAIGALNEIQGVKSTTSSRRSQSVGALGGYYPKTDNNKKLSQALEQSPIGLNLPNEKSLAKMGFKKVDLGNRAYGQAYQDKDGNTIYIGKWGADAESGMRDATRVRYESKDGTIEHNVYFTPDGDPFKGKMTKNPAPDICGGSTQTFNYEYDESGNPQLTKYTEENLSLPPQYQK